MKKRHFHHPGETHQIDEILLKLLDGKAFEKMVTGIILNIDNMHGAEKKRFSSFLKKHFTIKGYNDPLKASPATLIKSVLKSPDAIARFSYDFIKFFGSTKREEISKVIGFLKKLEDSQNDYDNEEDSDTPDSDVELADHNKDTLYYVIKRWEAENKLPPDIAEELAESSRSYMHLAMIDKLTEEYLAVHKDSDRLETQLIMHGILTPKTPHRKPAVAGKSTAVEVSEIRVDFKEWLKMIKELPADAPEWDGFEPYCEELRMILEDRNEKVTSLQLNLKLLIEEIITDFQNEIDFFSLHCVVEWVDKYYPADQLDEIRTSLVSLRESLAQSIDYRKPPANFEDSIKIYQRLSELKSEISSKCDHITGILTNRVRMEKPTASEQHTVEKEAETENVSKEKDETTVHSSYKVLLERPSEKTPEDLEMQQEIDHEESSEDIYILEDNDAKGISEDMEIRPKMDGAEEVADSPHIEGSREDSDGNEREKSLEQPQEIPSQPSESHNDRNEKLHQIPDEIINIHDVAALLKNTDNNENWSLFIWNLIREGDLPGAFWVSQALEHNSQPTVLPSWLIGALQGSLWMEINSDVFVNDLFEISTMHKPEKNYTHEITGIAAALCPALLAPATGLADWLHCDKGNPAINKLCTAILNFTQNGLILNKEDLLGASGEKMRQEYHRDICSQAERAINDGFKRNFPFRGASDTWHYLITNDLKNLLEPVKQNRVEELAKVNEMLGRFRTNDSIVLIINNIYNKIWHRRGNDIVGAARDQLVRYVQDYVSIASCWCEIVEAEERIKSRGDWVYDQIKILKRSISILLPELREFFNESLSSYNTVERTVPILALRRTVDKLLHILEVENILPSIQIPRYSCDWCKSDASDLITAMRRRLFILPDIEIKDNGIVESYTIKKLSKQILDQYIHCKSTDDIFIELLNKNDFRNTKWLLTQLFSDEEKRLTMGTKLDDAFAASKMQLERLTREVFVEMEKSYGDGIINEERTVYVSDLEEVRSGDTSHISLHMKRLNKDKEDLKSVREERTKLQHKRWNSIKPRIEQLQDKNKAEIITKFVEQEINKGNTRVIDESLAKLSEMLEKGEEIDERWFSSPQSMEHLERFKESNASIHEYLEEMGRKGKAFLKIQEDLRHRVNVAGIRFRGLPQPRLNEAIDAIDNWKQLKQSNPASSEIIPNIRQLLKFLGLSTIPGEETSVRILSTEKDWVYAKAAVTASHLARPIPQFGSLSYGNYNVVCLWDRPGAETFSARLHDLHIENKAIIVIYLGRLTERLRFEFMKRSKEHSLAIAILDEILLIFLAGEMEARFAAFLRCSLPYSVVNPYTPFQAGDVPEEMFFGRKGMVRELLNPSGTCIVYGGRQLGKSALLRQVKRQFDHPEYRQFSWVEDVKLIGDPNTNQLPEHIWRRLRDSFMKYDLMKRIATDNEEAIERQITEIMEKDGNLRVLVMFDEADNFLEADAKNNFRIVTKLRDLMVKTQRRFKVVFAGLHNVQRFQGIPNQPLAHFGAPLLVGPLEPDAAQKLVRAPLEVLGFRIELPEIFMILSHTNYHPGLIQLFCQELLRRLQSSPKREYPVDITQNDIENVYRNEELRERIKERFEWTLALDARYQTIAWSMIFDQLSIKDSYSRLYSSRELMNLADAWWKDAFWNVGSDEFKGLLQEMCGLGILIKNRDGLYRLRSPNLIRLMGTESEIAERLYELSKKPFKKDEDDFDLLHAPLDEHAHRYNPLNYGQERRLSDMQFSVCLITASRANGFEHLSDAIRNLAEKISSEQQFIHYSTIPEKISEENALNEWLKSFYSSLKTPGHLVCCQTITGKVNGIENRIRGAISFAKEHRRVKGKYIKVFFLLNNDALWQLLTLPVQFKKMIEEKTQGIVSPKLWTDFAIRRRLAQLDKIHTKDVVAKVYDATGGWPLMVEKIFASCGTKDDPRSCAQDFMKKIHEETTELRSSFISSLGLDTNESIRKLFDFLCMEREFPFDLMSPELIAGEVGISEEFCEPALRYLLELRCVREREESIVVDNYLHNIFRK